MAVLSKFYNLNRMHFAKVSTVNIVMLPKKEQPIDVAEFKPIGLIHSMAKLISKVLSLRLSRHMNKLISKNQSAFIKTHCIQDNFLYVQNLARNFHCTRTPTLMIKLDISKAFDSVSWPYPLDSLQRCGLGSRWREWVSILLATSNSAVILNGMPGPRIWHQCGVRQGDSLSLYLFILAIDVLYCLLSMATSEGWLSPLNGRTVKARLSLYADDAMIFLRPTKEDIDNFKEIMTIFGEVMGLKINLRKTAVILIQCQDLDLDTILHDFSASRRSFPCTYLGLPLSLCKLRKVQLQPLIDKIDARPVGYKKKMISRAGRLKTLKAVLTSMPIYHMLLANLPTWTRRQIDKRCKAWFWSRAKTV